MVLTWLSTAQAQHQSGSDLQGSPMGAVEATGENDVAVIVAIERYAHLPDIPGAVGIGLEWQAFFEQALGVNRVYFLTGQEATREEIAQEAAAASSQVRRGGTLWFVFIGHGAPAAQRGEAAFVGVDALQSVEGIQRRSLPRRELLQVIQAGRQAQTVMILDAAFSGRAGDGESLAPGARPVVPESDIPEIAETTVIMSAASADQYAGSLPDVDRPAFSSLLLEAFRQLPAGESGSISAEVALSYAHKELGRIPGRTQEPELVGAGDIELVRPLRDRQAQTGADDGDSQSQPPGGGDASEANEEDSSSETASGPRPEFRELSLSDDTALEIMGRVCGDEAKMGTTHGSREEAMCPGSCPDDFMNPDGSLTPTSAYIGDFSGDRRQDTIVGINAQGCGTSQADGHDGAYYLGESITGPYQHGVVVRNCEVIRFSDRDRLLCLAVHVAQGAATMQLEVQSVVDGQIETQQLTEIDELYDNSGGCYYGEGRFDAYITRQIIEDLSGDGEMEIAVGITERRGEPKQEIDSLDVEAQCDQSNYDIEEIRKLRIWTLDGDGFRRASELEEDVSHPALADY